MSIDWNWGIFLQQAPFGNTTYLGWIWSGFQVTIALSICAWIIAFLVGSFFGILRTVPNRFLSGLGTLYVELFRNVPLIVQFFTWYLVIPENWVGRVSTTVLDSGFYESEVLLRVDDQPVAAVYTITGENRESRAVRGNRVVLRRQTDTVYAGEVLEGVKAFTADDLRGCFRLIVASWTS